MRDLFEDLFAPEVVDPTESARASTKPRHRQRFYEVVAVTPEDETSYAVTLDGRPIRTPARGRLVLPNAMLAEAVATEWRDQAAVVDPARMPLTRLANSILDGVVAAIPQVAAEVEKYLGSDLLFYRAAGPDGLVARQAAHWDPILAWARRSTGAQFVLAEGVVYVRQPDTAIAAMRAVIPLEPWRLGAVHTVTTLTGSALIALAIAGTAITVDVAWLAAHVDEDWNMDFWGHDTLALERRRDREAEMRAAATVLDVLR
jgi:chaperone required for assembly of F1-ATPase